MVHHAGIERTVVFGSDQGLWMELCAQFCLFDADAVSVAVCSAGSNLSGK